MDHPVSRLCPACGHVLHPYLRDPIHPTCRDRYRPRPITPFRSHAPKET